MKLIVPILINCLLVLCVYLADKYTPLKKLSYMQKQIIIGVLFGGVSAFASSYGVDWLGAIVNVRDAAPLSAGLIFGAPAGIISGVIGGLYRWFSVYWAQAPTPASLAVLQPSLQALWRQGSDAVCLTTKSPLGAMAFASRSRVRSSI